MFRNLSIRKRLAFVLGTILLLSVVTSVFAVFKLRELGQNIDGIVKDQLLVERGAAEWLMNTTSGVQRAAAIARSSDPSLVEYFAPATAAAVERTTELQKLIEARMDLPHEAELFAKVGELRNAYLKARKTVADLKSSGDAEGAARAFAEQFEPRSKTYLEGVKELVLSQQEQLDQAAARTEALRMQTSTLLVVSSVIALIVGGLLAVALSRSILVPLGEAERVARAIGDMDLSGQASTTHADDETGRLLKALDAMRLALQRSLQQVRGVVDGISTASTQIATGNLDLSQRTEQTASNLQQAASSMEELTVTVRQTADSARMANQLASSAANVASRGGDVVSQVVSTMEEINQSSRRISDIIGTIDGIAFQTNILALNAAVEAARAGEQGRGFAVVASEVRSLAQRSAQAAKEIKSLISASVQSVESGSKLVQEAGTTMGDIVASVQRVTDIIGEITAATQEQSQGLGQVNGAVTDLDQMTQQNAALVEESSAAAESLREQAARLSEVVGTFRLGA
ncbi:methyl-accepting chemotaxis protein [Rhizobacter sp. LjRoot28]|jgi:methyl-accepting chemotaxis protein|uniref:methyl-accepting chemotaxis protein n=1 Tax=Rhizobacter sp. LjRoot28 TaxID=3342309 RepID=UPI003ECCBAB9